MRIRPRAGAARHAQSMGEHGQGRMPVTRRREHARIGNPDIVDRPKAAPGIAWSASAGSHGASAGLVKRCRADVASSSRNNSALSQLPARRQRNSPSFERSTLDAPRRGFRPVQLRPPACHAASTIVSSASTARCRCRADRADCTGRASPRMRAWLVSSPRVVVARDGRDVRISSRNCAPGSPPRWKKRILVNCVTTDVRAAPPRPRWIDRGAYPGFRANRSLSLSRDGLVGSALERKFVRM